MHTKISEIWTKTIKGLRMMSLPVSNISCRHDRRSTTIRTVCFVKKLRILDGVISLIYE